MDSSSSSSSSKKYDVFLSFRKEDTGRTFVSHLYRSLHQKGIRTYRDQNQQTGEGRRMSDEEASLGYRGVSYGRRCDIGELRLFRLELSRLSDFVPLCSLHCEDDSRMLDDLIIRIYSAMSQNITPSQMMIEACPLQQLPTGFDFDQHFAAFLELLSERPSMQRNERRSFRHGPSQESRLWIPSLLDHLTRTRSARDSFDDDIKPSLVNRNILLVVDDVRDSEQLKDIVKVSHWLGPGSRVIMITSKNKSSLVSCGVKHVYEMGFLRYDDEALHIFSQFAFKQDYPRFSFEQVTVRAVHLAGHLPLALKLLGSFLCGKDEETWRSTLQRLDASQGNNGIQEVCSYVEASEYLQIKSKRYIVADEGEYSPSYHMLL
ncbi:unnamed protein product [Brassica oleracea]|uniref:Uncharacterized protein n=2 Tax=Brassica TaxID=3705 RepID=A0A0D3AQ76_BRAOL